MSEKPSFFAELKRRNVYKVAVAYAVVGWLLVQVATQVFPFFEIPNWAVRLVVLGIVIGFPVALVIAWAFELTPEGLKRTEDVDVSASRARRKHAWIYIAGIGAVLSIARLMRSIPLDEQSSCSHPKKTRYLVPGISPPWPKFRRRPVLPRKQCRI